MSISTGCKYLASAVSMLAVGTAAFALQTPPPAPAPGAVPPGTRPLLQRAVLPGTVAGPVANTSPTNISGAKIHFDATVYDFGKVMAGEQVKHTFYFTNSGREDLVLHNVQGTCSCTVLGDWTRQVKPGDYGQIPVAFNAPNYSYAATKVIQAVCNDLSQPGGVFPLQLKGIVWKPIETIPAAATLLTGPDSPYASATLRITNHLDQLLVLSAPVSSNPLLGAELRTNTFGWDYQLIISNTAPLANLGTQGSINLKTSVTNIPLLAITTYASSRPPLTVVPMRIDLGQPPLATNQLKYLTIINNSTNPVALSEPSVNAAAVNVKAAGAPAPPGDSVKPGSSLEAVDVKITETQRGRYFTILLKFPTGFELPAGQHGSFTIKTTNPRAPLVTVPIYQALHSTPRSASNPAVLRRPASPIPGTMAAVPRPPRPNARPAFFPVSPPARAAGASPTNHVATTNSAGQASPPAEAAAASSTNGPPLPPVPRIP